jgi:MFS family permease
VGKTVLGRMVDRFGTRRVFVLSELAMAALLVVLIMGSRVYTVVGVSLLLGIVTKGTVPVVTAIVTEPARRKSEYDHIFAVNSFTRGLVNMAAPLLFGLVASLAGIHWSFGIMAVAGVCAVLPVLLMDKAVEMEGEAAA